MAFRPGAVAVIVGGIVAILGVAWSLRAGPGPRDPSWSVAPPGPGGAADLALAPGLSFTDDSSDPFPILGAHLEDGKIASDRPTAIFFGASHCYNTNREAERFVKLYTLHGAQARFLVVDLNNASGEQRLLVSRLYRGSIPTVAFLDRHGAVVWVRSGETSRQRGDVSRLEMLLEEAAARRPDSP